MEDATFAVTLLRADPTGDLKVLYADVHAADFRHRISFREGSDIMGALAPSFAAELRSIINTLPEASTVFAAPEHVVQLPGLVLARLRVLIHAAGQDTSKIVVRFKYFIGALSAVFRKQTYLETPARAHCEAAAVAALEDICLPACDLAMMEHMPALSMSGRDTLERRINQMKAQRDELSFYVSLLKRYVEQSGEDAEAPALGHDRRSLLA